LGACDSGARSLLLQVRLHHFDNNDVYREGYLRTSSSEYNTDKTNLNNDYIHLTNNAVQKNAPNYGNFEDGNQLSFQYFKDYISQHYPECANRFEAQILPKMKYYAALAMASVSVED